MKNIIWGYARVSSKDQDLARQLKAFEEMGIDERHIITDKQSGKDFERKGYKSLVDGFLRENDLLVIYSIDRLGRNYTEIMEQWNYITKEIKANIKVLDMPLLDTSKDLNSLDNKFVADLVLQILSYVAERERAMNKARQKQGLECMPIDENGKRYSRKTGNAIGRPKAEYPKEWDIYYKKWKDKEISGVQAMEILGLKKNTFYKLVKEYENN